MPARFATVDDYIASQPVDVRDRLEAVRQTIRAGVPGVGETISYQMPTITLDGVALVYFAGWKHHIGLYPVPRGDAAFEREVEPYRAAKDTVQFRHREPLPLNVLAKITALVVERQLASTG